MLLNKTKIAIAGVGTVGSGVLELFKKNSIHRKCDIELTALASRKKINLTNICFKNFKYFKDASEFLNFDDYDILIELIGGDEGISKAIVFDALKKGKHVVTANKALVSKYWEELNKIILVKGNQIKFEAAVAGGIPIVKIVNEFLKSNKIKKIYGILNGTSNYILTNMLNTNENFKKILLKSQKLGYAESDPSFDIDGIDSSHKLSILSSLAFGVKVDLKDTFVEGIRNIELIDLLYAKELGHVVKLLGITEVVNNRLINFVYPCMIDENELIGRVGDVYNGVIVESDFCKKSFFQGEGAGSEPTATSVLSDILDLTIREIKPKYIQNKIKKIKLKKISERYGSYYLRFSTVDKPGVISGISNEFKKNKISMKSMLQKDTPSKGKNHAIIVATTHNCYEKNMMEALKKINRFNFILKRTTYIRIENFK